MSAQALFGVLACTLCQRHPFNARGIARPCSRKIDTRAEGPSGQKAVLHNVNLENKRVKEVTDAILYDLLPAAIASATNATDEASQELTPDLCQVYHAVILPCLTGWLSVYPAQ